MLRNHYKSIVLKICRDKNIQFINENNAEIVAHELPVEILKAVVENLVIYDDGKKTDFFPFWIEACSKEIAERVLLNRL